MPLPLLTLTLLAQSANPYPTPRFTDPARADRLKAALPEVRQVFARWAQANGIPSLAYALVVDGQPLLLDAWGDARRGTAQATADTPFRIASMTKSFTALAVLKLRDQGKLSLEDEAARWIPELARFRYPTSDSPVIRVRHLLTHAAGFPEDNPWGDQQLGLPFADLDRWLRQGLPFSTAPGTAYEYSNYGFALAGRVIERASGRAYREYIETEILKPLRMTASTLEPAEARNAAIGYRFQDNRYSEEPSLPHGAFGAMGGLVTTARDLAKYVAFLLDAFPPRDGVETGPVKRSSVREMQQLWRFNKLSAQRESLEAPLDASASGYGYGLRIASDCRFGHIVAHGGGLPGFGSHMMWLPEHGVGALVMSNKTYAPAAAPLRETLDVLRRTGALRPREWPASPALETARTWIFSLFQNWSAAEAAKHAASNLFLDVPEALRQRQIADLKSAVGVNCRLDGPLRPENWLRGVFDIACDKGRVNVFFTLAPTMPPTVQQWDMEAAPTMPARWMTTAQRVADGRLKLDSAQAFTRAWGACKLGRVLRGDGADAATIAADCDRGAAELTIRLDGRGQVRELSAVKAERAACVP